MRPPSGWAMGYVSTIRRKVNCVIRPQNDLENGDLHWYAGRKRALRMGALLCREVTGTEKECLHCCIGM